jgi:parallel beta-helix repeat protein
MNWISNAPAGENGNTGKITTNTVIDDIWQSDTSTDTGDAVYGILVYSSTGITVSNNVLGSTQFGIAIETAQWLRASG